MKTTKRLTALLMAGLMSVTMLTGCGGNSGSGSDSTAGSTGSSSGSDKFKIGIIQLVEHDALDAAYKGFVEGLAEAGYVDGQNIEIEYENAQGEQANCNTIADKLIGNKCDLILAIATPAAQAVANKTKDIPILVTAVTDPADAKLVASNEAPGANISGTSDLNPIEEQMSLVKDLAPNAKTIAMLYNSSESNSVFQVELAKAEAEKLGLKSVDATVSNSNEIQQVVESLVGKADVIYAPTDNMIAAGMATVAMVSEPNGIPVICGETGMVANGGTATYGLNYYNLGKQTSEMAVKILTGKSSPANMPIEYLTETDFAINTASCEKMGIEVPQSLLDKITK